MAMHAVPLSALLTQAVGSDGTDLQAWILLALNKKRDGDGEMRLTCGGASTQLSVGSGISMLYGLRAAFGAVLLCPAYCEPCSRTCATVARTSPAHRLTVYVRRTCDL